MKVLHISTYDRQGGAGIAAYRMMESMCNFGIDAKMLVLKKVTDDDRVYTISKNDSFHYYNPTMIYSKALRRIKNWLFNPYLSYSCGVSGISRIDNLPIVKEADVIYIHWAQGGFLNNKSICRLIKTGKPLCFFLHDMWLTAGGCHYPIECEKWKKDCSNCPKIKTCTFINLSYWNLKNKQKIFKNAGNCTIISPSSWTQENAKLSSTLRTLHFTRIPNTLNTNTFSVIDRSMSRKILGLPLNKKLILFGAVGGANNKYKGWDVVEKIMNCFGNEFEYVVFGNRPQKCIYTIHAMGCMRDEYSLALLYNAVDVYTSPTLIETFGLTIAEAISCGTPVVASKVGGIPDIILHKENGYLANLSDENDFCNGIKWTIDHQWDRDSLHKSIDTVFSYEVVAKQHINLINRLFDSTN